VATSLVKKLQEETAIREELAIRVKRIKSNLNTVLETARDLKEICDRRLYQLDYKTFDDFCKATFNFCGRTGKRLIGPVQTPKTTDTRSSPIGQVVQSADNEGSKIEDDDEPREAGQDHAQEWKGSEFYKPITIGCTRLMNKAREVVRKYAVSKELEAAIIDGLRKWYKSVRSAVTEAPRRKAPLPKRGICKHCQAAVLWVTTENGKRMPVDAEPGGGQFDLIDGVAVLVDRSTANGQPLYRSHFVSCPNKPRNRRRS
jgi:hypothetical protein